MSKEDYRIVIADMPDKEEPVAEVYYKNKFWVEVSYEDHGYFVTKFYNQNSENYWEFPYEEAMEVLQEAKRKLARMQRTPEEQARYEAKMKAQHKKYYG